MLLGTNIKKLWKKDLTSLTRVRKSTYKEPEQLDASSLSSTSKQLTVDGKINNNEVTYAEIKWVWKTIVSGFSMNSVDDVCDTFPKMFPDSDIATRMKQLTLLILEYYLMF